MIEKYHMNKSEREMKDRGDIIGVLKKGKYMTLSLCSDNIPYIMTISYGYDQDRHCLYMHSSKKGLKLEMIKKNNLVCGTVVEDHGYVEKVCSHKYKSCVFEGEISIVESFDEQKHGMHVLINHLEKNPDILRGQLHKKQLYEHMAVLKIDIKRMTGKESL